MIRNADNPNCPHRSGHPILFQNRFNHTLQLCDNFRRQLSHGTLRRQYLNYPSLITDADFIPKIDSPKQTPVSIPVAAYISAPIYPHYSNQTPKDKKRVPSEEADITMNEETQSKHLPTNEREEWEQKKSELNNREAALDKKERCLSEDCRLLDETNADLQRRLKQLETDRQEIELRLSREKATNEYREIERLTEELNNQKRKYEEQQENWKAEKLKLLDKEEKSTVRGVDNKVVESEMRKLKMELNKSNSQIHELSENNRLLELKKEELQSEIKRLELSIQQRDRTSILEELTLAERRVKFLEAELVQNKIHVESIEMERDQVKLDLLKHSESSIGWKEEDGSVTFHKQLSLLPASFDEGNQIDAVHPEDPSFIPKCCRELERLRHAIGEQEHEVLELTSQVKLLTKEKDMYKSKYTFLHNYSSDTGLSTEPQTDLVSAAKKAPMKMPPGKLQAKSKGVEVREAGEVQQIQEEESAKDPSDDNIKNSKSQTPGLRGTGRRATGIDIVGIPKKFKPREFVESEDSFTNAPDSAQPTTKSDGTKMKLSVKRKITAPVGALQVSDTKKIMVKYSKEDMMKKKMIIKSKPSSAGMVKESALKIVEPLPELVRDLFPIYEEIEMRYLATEIKTRAKLFKNLVLQLQMSRTDMENLLAEKEEVELENQHLLRKWISYTRPSDTESEYVKNIKEALQNQYLRCISLTTRCQNLEVKVVHLKTREAAAYQILMTVKTKSEKIIQEQEPTAAVSIINLKEIWELTSSYLAEEFKDELPYRCTQPPDSQAVKPPEAEQGVTQAFSELFKISQIKKEVGISDDNESGSDEVWDLTRSLTSEESDPNMAESRPTDLKENEENRKEESCGLKRTPSGISLTIKKSLSSSELISLSDESLDEAKLRLAPYELPRRPSPYSRKSKS